MAALQVKASANFGAWRESIGDSRYGIAGHEIADRLSPPTCGVALQHDLMLIKYHQQRQQHRYEVAAIAP